MKDQLRTGAYSAIGGAIAAVFSFLFRTHLERFAGQDFPDGIEAALGILATWVVAFTVPILVALRARIQGIDKALVFLFVVGVSSTATAAPTGAIDLGMRTVGTGTAAYEVAELKVAPMVIINAISIPLDRRATFEAGVDVDGCYALHYSPEWWDETDDDPFASIGLCFAAGLIVGSTTSGPEGENHLAIQTGVALSVMRWIAIGFAYRFRLSLVDGGEDTSSPVLTLGLTAATF